MSHLARRLLGQLVGTPAARPAAGFGPDAVEVGPRALRVGGEWCRTFTVTGYPREVGRGWLEPLSTHPGRLDVALHVRPVPPAVAADRLRRQLARLESLVELARMSEVTASTLVRLLGSKLISPKAAIADLGYRPVR